MSDGTIDAPIRLAFRDEGEMWVCYLAGRGSMEGAVMLGSIRMAIVEKQPEVAEAFMEAMKLSMAGAILAVTGHEPTEMTLQPAPENERSGHG